MDGTGYGTDGAIWGGEILVGGYAQFERFAHLAYVPLPGGDAAIRKPARTALAHLYTAGIEWNPDFLPVHALCEQERTAIYSQLTHAINSPQTSSLGRLFDAVSSFLGVCHSSSYEGEAAISLEAMVDPDENGYYPFPLVDGMIQIQPFWQNLVADQQSGISIKKSAARFHNGLARMMLETCQTIRQNRGIQQVGLSGGVWQNMTLLAKTHTLLEEDGFSVFVHHSVPTNDGGLSIGQAAVAIHQLQFRG
jgi:hydrogenase maturation protein HypF